MAHNITLFGTNYADVPSLVVPATGGGTADFYAHNDPLAWLGQNPKYLGQIYAADYTLAGTAFNTWTPSTTAKDIIATANGTAFTADLANYEYFLRWRTDFECVTNSGATLKAQLIKQIGSQWQTIHKRPYGLARFVTMTDYQNYCATIVSASVYVIYYNTNGTQTWTTSNSYGIYPTLTAAALSATTGDTITVTPACPKVSARCYSSYFATARASEVDKAASTIRIRGDLYRVDKNWTELKKMYCDAIEMYSNPIPAITT